MDLKIIFAGNSTLIGRYEEETRVLHEPRAIIFGQDPQGRSVIGMQILVGNPSSLQILNAVLMYSVEDEAIVNLYIQTTTGIIPTKNLDNLIPLRGRNN